MSDAGTLTKQVCQASGICFYEGRTNGPTLILLHGVARNHTDWLPLLDALEADWHLVLVDHLGHGFSKRDTTRSVERYTVAQYHAVLARWFEHRSYSRVTIVGHSLGAMVALALAVSFRDRMHAAVLEDPPFDSMGREIANGPYQMQFAGMQRVAALQHISIQQRADALGRVTIPTANGLTPLSVLRDAETLNYLAECLSMVDPDVFTPLSEGRWLDGFDASMLWRECRIPVIGLQADPAAGGTWSDGDVQMAQSLCSFLKVVRFDQTGHQIHRTQPRKFLETLRIFR